MSLKYDLRSCLVHAINIVVLKPLTDKSKFSSRRAYLKAVLVGEPCRSDLDLICKILNSKKMKGSGELRRLVGEWLKSGPNLKKMLYSDSVLWGAVQNSWSSRYFPTSTGRARIIMFPNEPKKSRESARDEAHILFAALTLNPQWDLLAGPCARCKSYYIKKTRRQKVYCSQRCGSAATALPAVRKKRADAHAGKVKAVQLVLTGWTSLSERNWKEWIAKRTGVTVKWLSRAVNRGELSLPKFV